MNPLVKFMLKPAGRVARSVAGVALMAVGITVIGGTPGYAIAVGAVIPVAAGVFDLCPMAPFFRLPVNAAGIRQLNKA